MTKWVYGFGDGAAEGQSGTKTLLGRKGANLAGMSNLGLPVATRLHGDHGRLHPLLRP